MAVRFEGPLANHFGSYYPTGYVVAVLDGKEQAERAAQALRDAGHAAGDVRVFTGEEVLGLDRRFREERTLGQRLAGLLPADEGEAQQQYLEAAQRGHALVTVHASELAAAQPVKEILAAHGAHGVRHYGGATMTVLIPPLHE